MPYVLGIDLGTSSLKGLLLDDKGRLIYQASSDYSLLHPQLGYSEQDPMEWICACRHVFSELTKNVADFQKELAGLAISGQMHGLVTVDEGLEVVRPAILWNDTRTTAQCQKIMFDFGEEVIAITKNKALEGFTLPKILWMQEEEADLWTKVRHIMLPKDYLLWWLTGEFVTDCSDAAGTLMLDVETGSWSKKILNHYAIAEDILPEVLDSVDVIGEIQPHIQADFGFEHKIKVIAGGADNACAAIGAGIIDESTAMVSIGTSGVFLTYEAEAHNRYKGELHLFNHAIPNGFYSMGVTLAAGHSLNWFRDTFSPSLSFEELLSEIDEIPIGSSGLLFTPYIVGERTPYADGEIRGSFTGIDTSHTLKHFTRSVLEGITFSLKNSQDLMSMSARKNFNRIISVGGGSKNKAWLQIQADVFNAEIICLTTEQGPGLGAAILAAVGLGWFESISQAVSVFVHYSEQIHPIKQNVEQYQRYYQTYCQVYPALKLIGS